MFLGTIAHYELRSNVEFINTFRAEKMPQIHNIKLNRADSKNRVITLTRIPTKLYLNFSNFLISKDIGFNQPTVALYNI
jgi:hypothetical protein